MFFLPSGSHVEEHLLLLEPCYRIEEDAIHVDICHREYKKSISGEANSSWVQYSVAMANIPSLISLIIIIERMNQVGLFPLKLTIIQDFH